MSDIGIRDKLLVNYASSHASKDREDRESDHEEPPQDHPLYQINRFLHDQYYRETDIWDLWGEQKGRLRRVKYWEIIADNLKKAGWSYGYVSAIDREGRTIWIADAHRDDGKRYIVCSDEERTAFLELQRAMHQFAVGLIS